MTPFEMSRRLGLYRLHTFQFMHRYRIWIGR